MDHEAERPQQRYCRRLWSEEEKHCERWGRRIERRSNMRGRGEGGGSMRAGGWGVGSVISFDQHVKERT